MAKNGIEKALGTNKRLGAKKKHSGMTFLQSLKKSRSSFSNLPYASNNGVEYRPFVRVFGEKMRFLNSKS